MIESMCATPRSNGPKITIDKVKALADFLPKWYPEEGWPDSAPLTQQERRVVSVALWQEPEITWLRVLGTILNPDNDKKYLETSVFLHFTLFTNELESMFAYWIHSRHLREYTKVLLQTYHSIKVGAYYPALTAIVPLAETVIRREGFPKGFSVDYRLFYEKFGDGIGVQTAKLYTEILFEREPRGGIDNRERYNRHVLAHGISSAAVTFLDLLAGCLILDMVVSTVESQGRLLDRILTRL